MIKKEIRSKLINNNLNSGLEYLKQNNIDYRIAAQDGRNFILTCDYRSDRCNLKVEDDIIIALDFG